MSKDLYLDILDSERRNILPLLATLKETFYLAGGTGLALQLGHRDSVDFDFFQENSFFTEKLIEQLITLFQPGSLKVVQEEKDTVSILVDEQLKLSFFSYAYPLAEPLLDSEFFKLASVKDIGCMKLSAITSRSTLKDYVDLYFILHTVQLRELLSLANMKFPIIDSNVILKSLTYFDDVDQIPISYKHGHTVSFEEIKKFLEMKVQELMK